MPRFMASRYMVIFTGITHQPIVYSFAMRLRFAITSVIQWQKTKLCLLLVIPCVGSPLNLSVMFIAMFIKKYINQLNLMFFTKGVKDEQELFMGTMIMNSQ